MSNLTDREKFSIAMTIMVTSETAKKIPRDTRQALLDYIRKTYCPSVTDKDWSDIAQGLNEHKEEFMQNAMAMIFADPQKIMGDKNLLEFDSKIRSGLSKINFGDLKSDDPEIQKMLEKVKKDKADFDEGK